jgi:hypothetical protein
MFEQSWEVILGLRKVGVSCQLKDGIPVCSKVEVQLCIEVEVQVCAATQLEPRPERRYMQNGVKDAIDFWKKTKVSEAQRPRKRQHIIHTRVRKEVAPGGPFGCRRWRLRAGAR